MIKTGTEPTYHVFFDSSQEVVVMEWICYQWPIQGRHRTYAERIDQE